MKADRFVLEIELGNEAMQTWSDIADALRYIADSIPFSELGVRNVAPRNTEQGAVWDGNGNRVGRWSTE